MKKLLKAIFPYGTFGHKVLRKIAIELHLSPALPYYELQYSDWTERVERYGWSEQRDVQFKPKFSIIVPVYNTPAEHLTAMVYSVINQSYENWELILINASSESGPRELTDRCSTIDTRIRVVALPENLGIAGNTNAGLAEAKGDYIGLLDHDDLLAPQALYEIVLMLQADPRPQLIYSDEDKILANGEHRYDPHFKPDWSPQLLRELNYLNHFTVFNANLLTKAGPFNAKLDGAQDYDFFLRLVDQKPVIAHVPKILYHWRSAKTSTASNFSQKKNITSAGEVALKAHLERNGQSGAVRAIKDQPGFYRINYALSDDARLAVAILPSPMLEDYRNMVNFFLQDLRDIGRPVEVFVQHLDYAINVVPENVTIHYIASKGRQDFLRHVSNESQAGYCIIFNSSAYPCTDKWASKLAAILDQVDDIGIVAPFIVAHDEKQIIDAGLVKNSSGYMPLFKGYKMNKHTFFGNSDWVRNLDAVTGRIFAIKTTLLHEILDTVKADGPYLFSDAAYKKLDEKRLQVISWPFVTFIYNGELTFNIRNSRYFSSNLPQAKTEFSTFEIMRVGKVSGIDE